VTFLQRWRSLSLELGNKNGQGIGALRALPLLFSYLFQVAIHDDAQELVQGATFGLVHSLEPGIGLFREANAFWFRSLG
jgi:hypothetical protein